MHAGDQRLLQSAEANCFEAKLAGTRLRARADPKFPL